MAKRRRLVRDIEAIVAPLGSRGLPAAWLISYVFSLRDVGVSIVVYPQATTRSPFAYSRSWRTVRLTSSRLSASFSSSSRLSAGAAGLWLKLAAKWP